MKDLTHSPPYDGEQISKQAISSKYLIINLL